MTLRHVFLSASMIAMFGMAGPAVAQRGGDSEDGRSSAQRRGDGDARRGRSGDRDQRERDQRDRDQRDRDQRDRDQRDRDQRERDRDRDQRDRDQRDYEDLDRRDRDQRGRRDRDRWDRGDRDRDQDRDRDRDRDERRRDYSDWWHERFDDDDRERRGRHGRRDRDRDDRWDEDISWRDFGRRVLRGNVDDGRYGFQFPDGSRLGIDVRRNDGRREYFYRGGYGDHRQRSHRQRSQNLARNFARTADDLHRKIRHEDFRRAGRGLVRQAESFADAADRFYEASRTQRGYANWEFRRASHQWRRLDSMLSELNERRHPEVYDVVRQVDALQSRLDDRIGR